MLSLRMEVSASESESTIHMSVNGIAASKGETDPAQQNGVS